MTVEEGRRVTITAIAQEAGVSVPTVSRVLNGRNDVAPHTRERVEELLRRHGYRRRVTRSRTGASLIDLVFNDLDSPWAVEIIRGRRGRRRTPPASAPWSRRSTGAPSSARQWLQNLRTRATDGRHLRDLRPGPPLHARAAPAQRPDGGRRPGRRAPRWTCRRSARPTGPAACAPPSTCSRSATAGSASSPARRSCCAAGPGSTATARRWRPPACPVDDELIQPGDFYHESGFAGGDRAARPRRPADRRSSPPATRWPSASTRRSAGAACGCPTT